LTFDFGRPAKANVIVEQLFHRIPFHLQLFSNKTFHIFIFIFLEDRELKGYNYYLSTDIGEVGFDF
jgi:hypothetical protein